MHIILLFRINNRYFEGFLYFLSKPLYSFFGSEIVVCERAFVSFSFKGGKKKDDSCYFDHQQPWQTSVDQIL